MLGAEIDEEFCNAIKEPILQKSFGAALCDTVWSYPSS